MDKTLAYLGPPHSFCEEAARTYSKEKSLLIPRSSIEKVFTAVQDGKADKGIVPIENSCEGAVNQTLDLLTRNYGVNISGEIIVTVKHTLMTVKGIELKQIKLVLSHPQALAQCRTFLNKHLSETDLWESSSTAQAALEVSRNSKAWAAIGTESAARAYGLSILAEDIQDQENNETRFIVISKQKFSPSFNDKSSLLIYLPHKPGSLYEILGIFAANKINLSKIESRPARTRLGEYLFFIDIEGHCQDPRIKHALKEIESIAEKMRILGSYPAADVLRK